MKTIKEFQFLPPVNNRTTITTKKGARFVSTVSRSVPSAILTPEAKEAKLSIAVSIVAEIDTDAEDEVVTFFVAEPNCELPEKAVFVDVIELPGSYALLYKIED